ncbi:MAG: alkaline phosphatase family protein [archaeon]
MKEKILPILIIVLAIAVAIPLTMIGYKLTGYAVVESGPIDYQGDDFNVLVIGWDGVQRDHFFECYNKERINCPDGIPNLKELSGDNIYNLTITNGATDTKAGWSQMFTGNKAEVTGVYNNKEYQPIPEGYTIFEKLENQLGEDNITTLFIGGKNWHIGGTCPGEIGQGGEIEVFGEPWCLAKNNIDYWENNIGGNNKVRDKALELLDQHAYERFFFFIHFRDPDQTGHKYGENKNRYSNRIKNDDRKLGEIIIKLKELGIYNKTFIYVVTDHGFGENKKAHQNAPYGFFASNDPDIVRSSNRMDITPTLLEKYGLSLGAIGDAPAVNGQSLYSIPTECVSEGNGFVDYLGAPQCCSGLSLINLKNIKANGNCRAPTGGTGDNSGLCTNCGDGICTPPEHKCNCKKDCS